VRFGNRAIRQPDHELCVRKHQECNARGLRRRAFDALEDLFEEKQIDVFDIDRTSAV
jgi:hypothetical protein